MIQERCGEFTGDNAGIIGGQVMQRLDKMPGAIINRRPGTNPSVDAEAVK